MPFIDIEGTPPVLPPEEGGAGGSGSGKLVVNPVQLVDWFIGAVHPAYGQLDTIDGGDPDKYNLYRQWVNASGARVGTPELIAEYAVDLKVAITYDARAAGLQGAAAALTPTNFGSAVNLDIGGDVTGNTGTPWPQRIRALRVRLATRAQQPDRTSGLPAPDDSGGFLYRYCVANCGGTGALFARVRTVTTDIALPNQAQLYYP
jgi:hypothetical protein